MYHLNSQCNVNGSSQCGCTYLISSCFMILMPHCSPRSPRTPPSSNISSPALTIHSALQGWTRMNHHPSRVLPILILKDFAHIRAPGAKSSSVAQLWTRAVLMVEGNISFGDMLIGSKIGPYISFVHHYFCAEIRQRSRNYNQWDLREIG